MKDKKEIFAIVGSASRNSSNLRLIQRIADLTRDVFNVTIFEELKQLPHFDPELSIEGTPDSVLNFRSDVAHADGVLICTPEYVFSIPSGLKNAIEWCISTTVFSKKPVGIITASASGLKGHEELKLIIRTVEADFTDQSTLLISGIKAKINAQGIINDQKTEEELKQFIDAYKTLVGE